MNIRLTRPYSWRKILDKDWRFRKRIAISKPFLSTTEINHLILLHKIGNVYKEETGRKLHIKHPRSFNEKLIWLALYWKHPLKTFCADKIKVREYAQSKGLPKDIFPTIYGIWGDAASIEWDMLPQRYVLKCNHGCAMNILVKDKDAINQKQISQQLQQWLNQTYTGSGIEFQYEGIKPRLIFAEEFFEVEQNKRLADYKIMCINGRPEFILYCYDRDEAENAQLASFSLSWKQLFYTTGEHPLNIHAPKSLDKMISFAQVLSNDFPFVRVDFYDIFGSPYLSELTFSPYGNIITYIKPEILDSLGKKLKLPKRIS